MLFITLAPKIVNHNIPSRDFGRSPARARFGDGANVKLNERLRGLP